MPCAIRIQYCISWRVLMPRSKGPVPAAVVRKEWNSFKRGSPGRRMKSLHQINAMLEGEMLTDDSDESVTSDMSSDEDSGTKTPSAPVSISRAKRTPHHRTSNSHIRETDPRRAQLDFRGQRRTHSTEGSSPQKFLAGTRAP